MGVCRSVFCQMCCEHCGREHRAEVQFETGDDRQEEYENGQRIGQDDRLAPGECFPGAVDRFCPGCLTQWRAAHQAAIGEALAGLVEQGRLTLRSKNAATDHTPEELRLLGQTTRDNILRDPNSRDGTIALVFYNLTWGGKAVDFMDLTNDARKAFSKSFQGAVEDALKAAGWPLGRNSLREDFRVRIGEDRIISVHSAHGAPIR